MPDETDVIEPSREALVAMAEAMAAASGGRLRLARNEADASTQPEPEAATFLKFAERRVGRDLETYAFMADVQGGWEPVLPDIAGEIVLGLRSTEPDAYAAGASALVAMGRSVYPEERHEAWADLFEISEGPRP